MKKISSILLVIVFLVTLTSCRENEVEANTGSFVLKFPDEYLQYVPYTEIPNFVFEFEGTINTITGVSLSNSKMFSNNDDFILSDIISNFLKNYEEKERLNFRLITKEEKYETKMNSLELNDEGELKHKSHTLKVKDGEVFEEIALIDLENGLTLTIYYRRFVSDYEGEYKTYYAWSYRTLMEMVLHYPVILHLNEENEKEFLIVPLPTNVNAHLSVARQLPFERLLKDEYFEERFRSFNYPDYSDDPSNNDEFDLTENIRKVKDYYIRDFEGVEENDEFKFSYLGYNFKVVFDEISFRIDILD